jgi:autotransporter-associated beta strand protein
MNISDVRSIKPFLVSKPLLTALLMSFTGPSAFAQTVYTWSGSGTNDNFSNVSNWVGNVNGNSFGVQTFTGNTRLTPFADTTLNTHRLIFTNAGSFVLSGSRITFFDNSGTDPVIRNNSVNVQTINNEIRGDDTLNDDPLRLDANMGDLVFNGNITNRGSTLVIVGGSDSRYVAIGGIIHGAPNVNIDSGSMRILESGNVDNIGGSLGVGSSSTTNTSARLFIADMDGGKVVNKNISINQGNGSGGNRELGGLNTSGTNTFAGNITRSATGNKVTTLSAAAGGTVDFNGQIGGDHGIIIRGPGTVRYGGNNTYAGFTSIESGALHIKEGATLSAAGQSVFLGSGSTPNVSAGLFIADVDGGTTMDLSISVNPGVAGNRTIGGLNASGVNTFGGTIAMSAADRSATLYAQAGGTVAFTNVISGAGSITKTGDGTVRYDAANTYSGNTTIESGTLQLGASGSIQNSAVVDVKAGAVLDVLDVPDFTLASGQTLVGNGSMNGALTLSSGAVLAPGNSAGRLTFQDDVTLELGSIFEVEIGGYTAGSEYDDVVMMSGAVFYLENTTLDVVFLNDFDDAAVNFTTFTIVNGAHSGSFNGLSEGDSLVVESRQFQISYNSGNNITLTLVPEPASMALMGLGLAAFYLHRRRHAS